MTFVSTERTEYGAIGMGDWKESPMNERVERIDKEGVGTTQLKRVVFD